MSISLVTPPDIEPVTLEEARNHLRLTPDQTDEDGLISRLITAARMRGERTTRRAWITQEWDQFLDERPEETAVDLPKPPLQAVTFIHYTDMTGATQTWPTSEYLVDIPAGVGAGRGRVALGFAKIWPITLPVINCIQIRMVCGYGDAADDVPELLRQAMLMDIGTLFETRMSVLTGQRAASIEITATTREIYKSFRSL